MPQKRSKPHRRSPNLKPPSKRAPEAPRGQGKAKKPKPTWLEKTIGWNMHLTTFGQRLFEGRLNSSRIRAWMSGTHYPEVLPKEDGKPRMVRFVPVYWQATYQTSKKGKNS